MKDYLRKLPREIQELIRQASEVAAQRTLPVYLVGGFVRDLLLGVKNLDLDIVVEGDGIAYADELANRLAVRIVRHKRFGTATLYIKPHLKLDVATVRREYYPKPGYLPVVEPGVLKEDLFRRDFTINAMALDISRRNYGALIDFFGGKKDLTEGKIRVLHAVSFLDDPTRILRAVRFEQRYRFHIEPVTLKLVREAVGQNMLTQVDPQRVRDDLMLLLKEAQPVRNIRRLDKLTGFGFLHKSLHVDKKTYAFLAGIEREIRWFQRSHTNRRTLDTWLLYFIGLTAGMNSINLAALTRTLSLRKGEEIRVLSYRRLNTAGILRLRRKNVKPSRIYDLLEPLSYETILALRAAHADRWIRKHIADFFEIYSGMQVSVSGHDVKATGMQPGPLYQKIFTSVLAAKLDGEVKTREEEIALIHKIVAGMRRT